MPNKLIGRNPSLHRPMDFHKTGWIMLQLIWLAVWINPVKGNNPPCPMNFQQFATTVERAPIGTLISTLTATDSDGPNPISFRIDPTSAEPDLVTLSPPVGDSTTGRSVNVTLNRDDLDTDFNSGERLIKILMNDGTNPDVLVNIHLFIQDINDVAPQFLDKPYRASIPEDAPINSLVFDKTSVTDPDTGEGGKVIFSLETNDKAYKNTFKTTPYEGFINLMGPLDYEQHNFYQLLLTATDGEGLNSTTDVIVTVIDVQDTPPSFVNTPYTTNVKENATVGSSVISVSALDGDRGKSNPIKYRFTGDTFGDIFDIHNSTGLITVAKSLTSLNVDFSPTGSVFALKVLAEEIEENPPQKGETTATVLVTIRLEDINDNRPTFSRQSYHATVEENSQRGIPVQLNGSNNIFVQDLDQGTNSQFTVTVLRAGQPSDVFSVSPSTVFNNANLSVFVKNSSMLDYEELIRSTGSSSVIFQILAQETATPERHSGETTLNITVIDINDNFPQFSEAVYQAEVAENAAASTSVTTILATDNDSRIFAEISYKFVRGSEGKFAIDNNGVVTVIDGIGLDREKLSTYYLTVEAEDGGGNRNTSQLIITLTDMNDHSPVFLRTLYSGFLEENTPFVPLLLSASDGDEAGTPNSNVTYELSYVPDGLTGNFTIQTVNNEGQISFSPNLDFESLDASLRDTIRLEVTAIDQGQPPWSSRVNVTISVQDKNDKAPNFSQSVYHTEINETAAGGDFVIEVVASDDDGKAPNNVVQYSIDRGGLDKFYINPSSGRITVYPGKKFDRDVIGQYNLTVVARDLGNPQKSGSCTVTVTILDINNKNPEFKPNTKAFSVEENATEYFVVGRFSAIDPDDTHLLSYSIIDNKITAVDERGRQITSATKLDTIKNYFQINNESGVITVMYNDLDRELAEQIMLTVHVMDINAMVKPTEQTATGLVTITLLDSNDNAPDFSKPNGYSVNVSEREAVDYDVLIVSATDKDKQQTVTFQIEEDPEDIFYIEENSGQIKLKKKLDREAEPELSFRVIAIDSGKPAMSSTVNVTVVVQDVNDNNPQFVNHDQTKRVEENSFTNDSIIQLIATDQDLPPYGTVNYFIESGNTDGKFKLNQTSGELFLVGELDREKIEKYDLRIEARDNGEPGEQRNNFTQLTIIVTDVNDEKPNFNGTVFRVSDKVFENEAVNSFVYTLTAQDKDEGNNAVLTYSLGDGTNATSSSGQPLFKIDPSSGVIRVNELLVDYAGLKYLTVIATDKGSPPNSASATVLVNILDVNNYSPVIDPINDSIFFTEVSDVDKSVYNFTAKDKDQGDFGKFKFYLTDSRGENDTTNRVFKLDPDSGELKTKVEIDYEVTKSFNLYIQVIDLGIPTRKSPITPVFIQIVDADDNPPEFSGPRDTPTMLQVQEGATGVIGRVKAFDKDSINTSKICYCFIGDHGNFSLDITTGDISLLEKIDREATPEPRDLVIKALQFCNSCGSANRRKRAVVSPPAYDKNDPTLLWVRVNIKDVNDNKPVFTTPDISVGITRDTRFGDDIISLAEFVTDADKDNNNTRHSYSLMGNIIPTVDNLDDGNPSGMFKILTTGVVKANTYFKADWFGFFSFIVEVKDSAGNSTANVKIYLINQDQQIKIVILDSLENVNKKKALIVKRIENATGGNYEIIVDKVQTHLGTNGNGDPSKVNLFIHGVEKSTKKVISGTELLRLIDSKLKFLIDTYRKYSVVEVLDMHDQVPIFSQSVYHTEINESSAGGDFVIEVVASDDDEKARNNVVLYSIDRGGLDKFYINPSSGRITVYPGEKFDRDVIGQYNLTVVARDLGNPHNSGSCTVTVTILDINNKNPEFKPNTKAFSIYDNVTESFVVGRFTAMDPDDTHLLSYSIIEDQVTAEDKYGNPIIHPEALHTIKGYFCINNSSGLIRVKSGSLNRELAEYVHLTIHVVDLNAVINPDQQTATGLVTITLLDSRD